jgi:hypothetical protein
MREEFEVTRSMLYGCAICLPFWAVVSLAVWWLS